jgi:hypothetical protein
MNLSQAFAERWQGSGRGRGGFPLAFDRVAES